ncbi:hypothetical protein KBD81_01825 [Candidatus Woesebacteria bacterium]|nr:hypothetical protein [Candidatus Woesebacteria bacterium]
MKLFQHSLSLRNIILVTIITIVLCFLSFVGLVFYQDYLEDECYKKVDAAQLDNPNELIEISLQEKKELKIDESLIPSKRYYEMQKCMQGK